MGRSYRLQSVALVVVAGAALLVGGAKPDEDVATSDVGSPGFVVGQLISAEPLPPEDGLMCRMPSSLGLVASLQAQERPERRAAAAAEPLRLPPGTVDLSQRKPIRKIHDYFAAFSAIAVDTKHNEVVMADENLFAMHAYDRLTNTPPKAPMSEPKRRIGGLQTDIEYQCAIYIDPENGDIYAVNNDTVGRLVVFSRGATGDVPPDRYINTPDGTFGIAVDEVHQELMLSIEHDSAVVTYPKMAKEDDPPIRLLQGDKTLLADPHGMALDTVHDVLFVTNHGSSHRVEPSAVRSAPPAERGTGVAQKGDYFRGIGKKFWPVGYNFAIEEAIPGSGTIVPSSITVYPRSAGGNTPPIRVITGPRTRLNWPTALSYDPRTNELFVANDMGDEILVFAADANGDVPPLRILKGPKTKIKNPTGVFVDTKHDELWVANFGNHTATVYKSTASGDVPPLRIIRTAPEDAPTLMIGNARIDYDTKREQILVPN